MINEALEVFKKIYDKEGEELVVSKHIPKDGTYILVNIESEKIINKLNIAYDKKNTKIDGELAGMLLAYEGVTYTNADYSLKRIKEKYENYDEYFEKEYNLDKDALQRLRDLYTE